MTVASIAERRSNPASPSWCAEGNSLPGRTRLKGSSMASGGLDELQPVPERVSDMTPVEPLERHVVRDPVSRGLDPFAEPGEVLDQEGRVCLSRGRERLLDAEMHLEPPGSEPHAAARRQLWRLLDLREAEHRPVEADGVLLLVRRHRELDVVQPYEPRPRLPHRARSLRAAGRAAAGAAHVAGARRLHRRP